MLKRNISINKGEFLNNNKSAKQRKAAGIVFESIFIA